MPKGRPKKEPFEDLDKDFKALIESATEEDIRKKISEVALNEFQNQENKKADGQLAEAGAAYKEAGAQYKEATKHNKLRIGYARFMLDSRGKLNP
jgi:hypothetical protein